MKYKFKVMVFLTYKDKDIESVIDLSDKDVSQIKELVSNGKKKKMELLGEDDFQIETDLLMILETRAPKLFNKFWKIIMPPVFIELLIDGIENYGSDIKLEEDHFADYREASFDELYAMYGETIDIEHSSCCICKIPESWLPIDNT